MNKAVKEFLSSLSSLPRPFKILAAFMIGLLFGWTIALTTSCGLVREDSPAEEIVEGLIQHHTGVDIDLTPRSPEGEYSPYYPPQLQTHYRNSEGEWVPFSKD